MTLRAFHVVFVSASALVAFFFAFWCFRAAPSPGAGWAAAGAASAALGLGLIVYEAWFLRKTRGLHS
jgi:hypothetical protein